MLSNAMAKAAVTITMWLILGFISFVAIAGEGIFNTTIRGDATAITLVPLVLAMIGTAIIWTTDSEKSESSSEKVTVEALEKAKREGKSTDRLALLLELMDEDERSAFKESLKQGVLADMGYHGDGESPFNYDTLESLLDEGDQEKRLRG